MKRIILCFAIFLCLSGTHAYATKEFSDSLKSLQLFTNCQPIYVAVVLKSGDTLKKSGDALKNGLTMESVQKAAESRLRSSRIYSNQILDSFLIVNVQVVGQAVSVDLDFLKTVLDPFIRSKNLATTWSVRTTGMNGSNPGMILSTVYRLMDKFLIEFLRANDEACRKKK